VKKRPNVRKPVMLFNTGPQDREACHLVMASGIPCEFLTTTDENAPMILYNHQQFTGLEEIKRFVAGWRETRAQS